MTELAVLLFVAAIGYGLSRWTGIPAIPLLLGLGMVLSFSGLVSHDSVAPGQEEGGDPLFFVIELGLAFLVFASGIEMNPSRFRRQRRAVLWVGIVQFSTMGLVGWLAAGLLGYTGMEAVYLGFAVSASSTLVVLRQLQLSQQSFEPHGRMVIGVLLVQDALTIAVLIALTHHAGGAAWVATGFGWAALMTAAAWFLQRGAARWIVERCRGDEESMLLAVLTVLFVFLGGAHFAELPLVVGAFLAGYSLSGFPVSGLVSGLILSLTDFFRAIFFVALGALVVVPAAEVVGTAVILSLLIIVITPPLVTAIAEWTGLTTRAAVESGLLLAQTSEYSLILGFVGMQLGHLSAEAFAVIALMAVATMTCTPLLARDSVARFLVRLHPLRRRHRLGPSHDIEDHVLILGLGSGGMWVLRPLLKAGVPVLVVDDDPVVIAELDREGVPCLRGDGSDEHVLDRAGASKARLILASMRRVGDAEKVLAHTRGVPVLARVFEEEDAERIRNAGGIPVSNSEAAADGFLAWFGTRFGEGK